MLNMNKVIAKNVSTNQNPVFWLYWLLNLLLFFTNKLDFNSFLMLQTRPLYLVYEQSYGQKRLNQSKYSILVISVSMVTLNQIL